MASERSPMTVTVTRGVRAGADRMWQVISTPGYLELCHPFCERNPVEQARVRWRIEAKSHTACRLTVSLRLLFLDHVPTVVRWVPYCLLVRPRMKRYLEAAVAGVVYHAETDEPVVRNRFGSHPWFSPTVHPRDVGPARPQDSGCE